MVDFLSALSMNPNGKEEGHAVSRWDPSGVHPNGSYKAGESVTINITITLDCI